MTSQETIEQLSRIKELLSSSSAFLNLVRELADEYPYVYQASNSFSRNLQLEELKTIHKDFVDKLTESKNIVSRFRLRDVFNSIADLRKNLSQFADRSEILSFHIRTLCNDLDLFAEIYEGWIVSRSRLGELIIQAYLIERSFSQLLEITNSISSKLIPQIELQVDESELKLYFYNEEQFSNLVSKLSSLEGIYNECCFILGVSVPQFPLRIIKVESGSLYIDIAGNAAVIALMVWIIKNAVQFLYRTYTREGQISLIPKEIEVADHILQFTKKLEAEGIDTTNNKEQVQKVLFTITEKMNVLVAHEPKIKINDQELSPDQELEKKYLGELKTLMIGDGNDSSEFANKVKRSSSISPRRISKKPNPKRLKS